MNGTRGIWVIALSLLTVVVIASNPTGLIAIIGLLMAVVFFSLFSHYLGLFTKLSVWCLSAIVSVCCFAASLFLVWGSFRITSSPNSWPLSFPFPDEVVLTAAAAYCESQECGLARWSRGHPRWQTYVFKSGFFGPKPVMLAIQEPLERSKSLGRGPLGVSQPILANSTCVGTLRGWKCCFVRSAN